MAYWTFDAIRDAQQAWDYIAADNEMAANRIVDTVEKSAQMLDRFPRIGRMGIEKGTRELVVPRTPYKLVYRIRDEGIEILRVIHGKRAWPQRG